MFIGRVVEHTCKSSTFYGDQDLWKMRKQQPKEATKGGDFPQQKPSSDKGVPP